MPPALQDTARPASPPVTPSRGGFCASSLVVCAPRNAVDALAHFPERVHPSFEEGLIMRHPSKLRLNKGMAYRAGAIGLGLLPIAMAFAAVLIP